MTLGATMIEQTEAYGFTFSFPSNDITVGRCLREYGEFGRIGCTLAGELASGGSFMDVGANIGAYALPVSRRATQVIAIEANPPIARILSANVEANRLKNITVIAAAAGAAQGSIDFPATPLDEQLNFGGIGIATPAKAYVEVPVVTLDSLTPPDLRVVKIDVEGYEGEVLKGAADLLNRVRPTWLVETSADTPHTRAVIDTFLDAGYRLYWVFDAFVTPMAVKARWRGRFLGDLSVLAIPPARPQPQGMVEILRDAPWPTSTAGFKYLRAFGMPDLG